MPGKLLRHISEFRFKLVVDDIKHLSLGAISAIAALTGILRNSF